MKAKPFLFTAAVWLRLYSLFDFLWKYSVQKENIYKLEYSMALGVLLPSCNSVKLD